MTIKQISVVQMNSGSDVNANLKCAEKLIEQAAAAGAKVVVLPEVFAFIGSDIKQQLEVCEEDGSGPIQDFLAAQAAQHQLWLLGGTVPLATPSGDKVYAAALLYDEQGQRVTTYHKIHLFDVYVKEGSTSYTESDAFAAGQKSVVVVDTPVGRMGIAVCYDLRFPEMFRLMVDAGAEIIALPAAFTEVTGQAHWHILLKARAIENQVYIAAAAQVGEHSDRRKTYGHSIIVDPWGDTLVEVTARVTSVTAAIDLDKQKRLRQEFPCLSHRVLNMEGTE